MLGIHCCFDHCSSLAARLFSHLISHLIYSFVPLLILQQIDNLRLHNMRIFNKIAALVLLVCQVNAQVANTRGGAVAAELSMPEDYDVS